MLYLIQTIKEYYLSIVFSFLLMLILPNSIASIIQQSLIHILTAFPISFQNILVANLLSMLAILCFGLTHYLFVSFFVSINGIALGIMMFIYKNNLPELFNLLFPHVILETLLIILFSSVVKLLSLAYREKQYAKIPKYWCFIVFVCLPMWLLSSYLEIIFFEK